MGSILLRFAIAAAVLLGAAGVYTPAQILAVALPAAAKPDEAFQPKIGSWTGGGGKTVTGPVFTWEKWDGTRWV